MKKRILFIWLFLISAGIMPASAQPVEATAFGEGEELTYTASYSAAILSTDVATVTLKTAKDKLDGIHCYKVTGRGQTKPFFSVFFKMDDIYTTWIERDSLKPLLATAEIKEGSYRYQSRISFNWKSALVYTHGKNLKRGYERGGTKALKELHFDPLTHFFYLRNTNLAGMKAGERRKIDVVMVDTVYSIGYKYLGKEIIDAPSTGEVRCLKFSCQLANGDGESFPDGSEFIVWLSDDKNKIPIYLETPIRIGSVFVTLTGWKGLANPFDSQLKPRK